jgi:hypothetical protein
MRIYLFRDESDNGSFALLTDVTGSNIPPVTPHTEWIFLEAVDTLKFPEPWDITDFEEVLDHLKADGYYAFLQVSVVAHPSSARRTSRIFIDRF